MTIINIPNTLDEAVTRLGALGELMTAAGWERAAILAAYVLPDAGHGGRDETATSSHLVSAREFSRRGIHGLRSKDTVLRYVTNWLSQRDRPGPGDTINLDGLPPWPPDLDAPARNITGDERREALVRQAEESGTGASKVLDIASNPRAMQAAIEGDPATFRAAREAVDRAEFKEMVRDVGGNPDRQGGVPDPEPRWHKLTRRIAMDVLEIKTHVGQLRAEGQQNTADLALNDLREVLAEALSGLEDIPNTIEGIEA